jgi:hypothetical protein
MSARFHEMVAIVAIMCYCDRTGLDKDVLYDLRDSRQLSRAHVSSYLSYWDFPRTFSRAHRCWKENVYHAAGGIIVSQFSRVCCPERVKMLRVGDRYPRTPLARYVGNGDERALQDSTFRTGPVTCKQQQDAMSGFMGVR